MRENIMITAEFSSPEIGVLSVKRGTAIVKAYSNAEAWTKYTEIMGDAAKTFEEKPEDTQE